MAWRQVGKLVAGNTADGVLDILHEWKFHGGQDFERLSPPSSDQSCQHVPVCEGCQKRFTPEGTRIPSSVCMFPQWNWTSPTDPRDGCGSQILFNLWNIHRHSKLHLRILFRVVALKADHITRTQCRVSLWRLLIKRIENLAKLRYLGMTTTSASELQANWERIKLGHSACYSSTQNPLCSRLLTQKSVKIKIILRGNFCSCSVGEHVYLDHGGVGLLRNVSVCWQTA